jgi:hypothetical protein
MIPRCLLRGGFITYGQSDELNGLYKLESLGYRIADLSEEIEILRRMERDTYRKAWYDYSLRKINILEEEMDVLDMHALDHPDDERIYEIIKSKRIKQIEILNILERIFTEQGIAQT